MNAKYDPGFNREIDWDIPLLDGYQYEFLENTSTDSGSHHFRGIINPDIVDRINSYQPNAILVYGWSFKSHLRVMRYYKGKIPVLFRGDSTLLDKAGFIRSIARLLWLKFVYRYVDKALYVGRNNKVYFLKYGFYEANLIYAPHTVDNLFFHNQETSYNDKARAWKKDLGNDKENIVFLFAGKLEQKKSPLLLLQAFQKAKFTKIAHLIVIGSGEMEEELKQFSKSDRVHFIGFQNQRMMPVVIVEAQSIL